MHHLRVVFCLSLVIAAGVCGCGPTAPKTSPLSGKVTCDGKPAPYATITFTPHVEKGNSGPAGSATVENGTYQTRPDYGVVGGAYIVHIEVYDGKRPEGEEGPMWPHGRLLVDYRTEIDLGKDATTRDFDIPLKN